MEEVLAEVEEISNAGTDSNLNKLKNPPIERPGDFFVGKICYSYRRAWMGLSFEALLAG